MKILIAVIITLVVSAGVFVPMAMRGKTDDAKEVTVRFEPVARGDLSEIVSAPGVVKPKTKVQISAKVVARIIKLPYEEGMKVEKDKSLLVELDSVELQAQLDGAKARYEAQKAQLAAAEGRIKAHEAAIGASKVVLYDAERDLKRQKELLPDVAQAIVDAAQTRYDEQKERIHAEESTLAAERSDLIALQNQLLASQFDMARIRDNLSYTKILSPIDGVVTRLNAKAGELVVTGTMNNAGTVIMEVADLSEMLVEARVDESNIAGILQGQHAKIRLQAYPDDTFDGTVRLVALDTTSETTGASAAQAGATKFYKVEIVLDTHGKRILAGLTADIDVETQAHRGVMKIPSQAVLGKNVDELPAAVRDNPEVDKNKTLCPVVFRVENDKAVITPVAIGASDTTHTVIKSGLKEGDRVVTGPYKALSTLAHDQKVKEDKATTKPATAPTTAATQPGSLTAATR